MASHPMTGETVGEKKCDGGLLGGCSNTTILKVAKTGAVYSNCAGCGTKYFYSNKESQIYLDGLANDNEPKSEPVAANDNVVVETEK